MAPPGQMESQPADGEVLETLPATIAVAARRHAWQPARGSPASPAPPSSDDRPPPRPAPARGAARGRRARLLLRGGVRDALHVRRRCRSRWRCLGAGGGRPAAGAPQPRRPAYTPDGRSAAAATPRPPSPTCGRSACGARRARPACGAAGSPWRRSARRGANLVPRARGRVPAGRIPTWSSSCPRPTRATALDSGARRRLLDLALVFEPNGADPAHRAAVRVEALWRGTRCWRCLPAESPARAAGSARRAGRPRGRALGARARTPAQSR